MSLGLKNPFSLTRIKKINIEETKKVAASIMKALLTPHLSTITPPNPNPKTAATIAVVETKEFARNKSFLLTNEGTIAIFAGIKNLPAQKERKMKR